MHELSEKKSNEAGPLVEVVARIMEDPMELHEAASLGLKDLLENLLLDGQYDVDSEDLTYEKKTPLHVAVEQGEKKFPSANSSNSLERNG